MAIDFKTIATALADASGSYVANVSISGVQLIAMSNHLEKSFASLGEDVAVEWAVPLLAKHYAENDTALELLHRGRRGEFIEVMKNEFPGLDNATGRLVAKHADTLKAIDAYRQRKAEAGRSPKKSNDIGRLKLALQGDQNPEPEF